MYIIIMEEKINIIKNDIDTSDYETRIIFLDELYEAEGAICYK